MGVDSFVDSILNLTPFIIPTCLVLMIWIQRSYDYLDWRDLGTDLIMNSIAIHFGFFLFNYKNQIWLNDTSLVWVLITVIFTALWLVSCRLSKLSKQQKNTEKITESRVVGIITIIMGLIIFIFQIKMILWGVYT